jgi:hypothetical protein
MPGLAIIKVQAPATVAFEKSWPAAVGAADFGAAEASKAGTLPL